MSAASLPTEPTADEDGDDVGTVVISVDAELGWGHHDLDSPPDERVEYARTGWIRLLSLFEEFDVPATWAVVGHLFLEECDGRHADHPLSEAWFRRETGSWADRPELRFADGLIERVEAATPSHELGCHGFSHVELGDEGTTAEVARAELDACEAAAGRSFDSFVFPRNNFGHRRVLAERGFQCYRGPAPTPVGEGTPLRAPSKLADGLLGRAPPLVVPHRDDAGLVNVPASMYLFDFEGPARSLVHAAADDPVVRRARRGLDAAAETGGVLHLWLHPNNLAYEHQARRVRAILASLAAHRDAGSVVVETMTEVAERV